MARMFVVDGKPMRTWNPYTGCLWQCRYCWSRKLVEERLQSQGGKYKDGFTPTFHENELAKSFKAGEFVAISLMGDISWAKDSWRDAIIDRIRLFPDTKFLFQSKNPLIFHNSAWPRWDNIYYGTTIESNRDYGLSKAPEPYDRYQCIASLNRPHKFISIEPIMDFDFDVLTEWMQKIKPEIVKVGADNYRNSLPEPPWSKVEKLLGELRKICKVEEKEGLERLR